MNIGNAIAAAHILASVRSNLKKYSCCFLAATALVSLSQVAAAQTAVPVPTTSPCNFKWFRVPDWFPAAGQQSIPLNGFVNPADSLHFPLHTIQQGPSNCDFYAWSAQMFLWLTSPAPSSYGQGSHVFNSPVFYDVSAPNATTGRRTLIRISPGKRRSFEVSIPQLGPQGKPVVFDNTGKMFTVIRPQVGPSGKTLVRNNAGKLVEIARVQVARSGEPVFLDKAGKAINFQAGRNGSPIILDRAGKQIDFQAAQNASSPNQRRAGKQIGLLPPIKIINGMPFLLDGTGNLIDIEQGQADGNVLMAQNGSLVYYALEVNDVYEAFLTGQKIGVITAAHFPNTQQDLTNVQNYAGVAFPDANVLTVELKTAWIETTGLAHPERYVTITATIPAYTPPLTPPFNQTTITQAAQSAPRQATLALVGMHIVGTVLGHPEMIWATFEHVNNSPNAPYTYNTPAPQTPPNGPGPWNFSATGASSGPIAARMKWDPSTSTVSPVPPYTTLGRSDVYRINAWGTGALDFDGINPNSNFTSNNSDIIAVNNSFMDLLTAGDVRQNYILTGTTWVEGFVGDPPDPNDPISQLGTNGMANTTMETFKQGGNCFMCHGGTTSMLGTLSVPPPTPPVGDGLSHIYGPLLPLISK
jgi:hypothetical protein